MCLTILVLLSDRIRITPVARQFDYHIKAIGVFNDNGRLSKRGRSFGYI